MKRSEELRKLAVESLSRARAAFDKADKAAKEEKRQIKKEEQAEIDAMLNEHESLRKQAEDAARLEKADEWSAESTRATDPASGEPVPGSDPGGDNDGNENDVANRALRAWALSSLDPAAVREQDVKAARKLGFMPGSRHIDIRLGRDSRMQAMQRRYRTMSLNRAYEESRALTTTVGSSGGFTIAPNFSTTIESAMLYFGPMLQVAEIIRTENGADLPLMTANETSKGGTTVGENTAITTTETLTFNTIVLKQYKKTTNAILVPFELLRDTAINLVGYIGEQLGERLGRCINTNCTTGTVDVQGITTKSVSGKTTASSTAITMDEILSLLHSVDVAYRNGAAWMMHDSIALQVRLLKDGMGRYLWSEGAQSGQPDRLHGYPVFINNDMASSLTSGAKSILFGQLSKYKIRMVGDIRLTQTDQRYWEYDQMGFAAYVHFDGNLLDAGTNPVKHMTQV